MKEIVQDVAKVLHEVAKPVPKELFGTVDLSHLIKDMAEALDTELEGVALAAPQVGVSYRLFIMRVDRTLPSPDAQGSILAQSANRRTQGQTLKPEIQIYINPEIIKTSRKRTETDEGCLSIRNVYGTTKRHERVTLRARRPDGSSFTRGAGGLLAQIFEHEMDHLNGILFIEHASHLIHIDHEPTE